MMKLSIQRMENETDGEFICRLMTYVTELENEAVLWRNIAKEILKVDRNLRSVTKLLRDMGVIPDEYEIMMRYEYQQSSTKADTQLSNDNGGEE